MFRRLFRHFVLTTKTTQPPPQVFTVNSSITCNQVALLFNMTKFFPNLVNSMLVMVNYACGFNQSETGKYFEWIIKKYIFHAHTAKSLWFILSHGNYYKWLHLWYPGFKIAASTLNTCQQLFIEEIENVMLWSANWNWRHCNVVVNISYQTIKFQWVERVEKVLEI